MIRGFEWLNHDSRTIDWWHETLKTQCAAFEALKTRKRVVALLSRKTS